MAIIDLIKGLFNKEEDLAQKSVQKLKTLAPEERDSEIRDFLYKFCFDNAARFVHTEMNRKDSPFVELSRDQFFCEILLLNFWMVDKVLKKYRPDLAVQLHQRYFGSLPDSAGAVEVMSKKFRAYYEEWDDYTGHQDLFGMKVGELLFNSGSGYPGHEVSFWIISYSDEAIKTLKMIRKAWMEANIL